jgi:hypothetical protein
MSSIKIAGKELRGHGTLPFSSAEVQTRKVKDGLRLEDLPATVVKHLSKDDKALLLAAGKDGVDPKSPAGLELLKKIVSHDNRQEVIFKMNDDLYIASSAQLHRQGLFAFGIGKEGDKVEWNGSSGVVLHVDKEMDHGRKAALVALAATGIGIGAAAGLGAFLPVAGPPIKVLGGAATVVAKHTIVPGWLLSLKAALPWAGGITGGLSAVLGSIVGYFKRDLTALDSIGNRVTDTTARPAQTTTAPVGSQPIPRGATDSTVRATVTPPSATATVTPSNATETTTPVAAGQDPDRATYLQDLMKRHGGDIFEAAKDAGFEWTYLRDLLKKYHVAFQIG